jgi:hypothetical protein
MLQPLKLDANCSAQTTRKSFFTPAWYSLPPQSNIRGRLSATPSGLSTIMRTLFLAVLVVLCSSCATSTRGIGQLPPDVTETLAAAKAGSPKAMEAIGEIFHYGRHGVKRDLKIAFTWYQAAASQGLASSQDYVGMFYAGGLGGVAEDCGKSIDWFLRAAAGGFGNSSNNAAWMFATCPDAKYRDGKRALALSLAAVQKQSGRADFVGTLAAAYAEVGDFSRAIKYQEESIRLMQQKGEKAGGLSEALVRLSTYKKRKPWRGISYASPEDYRPQ